MAELLSIPRTTYSRLERNETKFDFEDLPKFAQKLGVPVEDLLPEIFRVHNNPTDHSYGIVFGSPIINNFYSLDDSTKELQKQILDLQTELAKLKKP